MPDGCNADRGLFVDDVGPTERPCERVRLPKPDRREVAFGEENIELPEFRFQVMEGAASVLQFGFDRAPPEPDRTHHPSATGTPEVDRTAPLPKLYNIYIGVTVHGGRGL